MKHTMKVECIYHTKARDLEIKINKLTCILLKSPDYILYTRKKGKLGRPTKWQFAERFYSPIGALSYTVTLVKEEYERCLGKP